MLSIRFIKTGKSELQRLKTGSLGERLEIIEFDLLAGENCFVNLIKLHKRYLREN